VDILKELRALRSGVADLGDSVAASAPNLLEGSKVQVKKLALGATGLACTAVIACGGSGEGETELPPTDPELKASIERAYEVSGPGGVPQDVQETPFQYVPAISNSQLYTFARLDDFNSQGEITDEQLTAKKKALREELCPPYWPD
jgi:hypothetical protein